MVADFLCAFIHRWNFIISFQEVGNWEIERWTLLRRWECEAAAERHTPAGSVGEPPERTPRMFLRAERLAKAPQKCRTGGAEIPQNWCIFNSQKSRMPGYAAVVNRCTVQCHSLDLHSLSLDSLFLRGHLKNHGATLKVSLNSGFLKEFMCIYVSAYIQHTFLVTFSC